MLWTCACTHTQPTTNKPKRNYKSINELCNFIKLKEQQFCHTQVQVTLQNAKGDSGGLGLS